MLKVFVSFFNWRMGMNVLFVFMILLPSAALVIGNNSSISTIEKRRLQSFPTFSFKNGNLREYVQEFNAYFDDNFGYREKLIHRRSLILARVFGVSSSPKVVLGKHHWMYYNGEQGENVIENYYGGFEPFTLTQLAAITNKLVEHQKWLAKRHIAYYLVIGPNKETIYPEFLPSNYSQVNSVTRLDQLIAYLHQHTSIPVVDVRPALLAHKNTELLYYKTDAHWNATGAFYAYQPIVAQVRHRFPQIPLLQKPNLFHVYMASSGDLANMLDLDQVFPEELFMMEPVKPCAKVHIASEYHVPGALAYVQPFATECNNSKLPKAVIVRDSFTIALVPLLAEEFRHAVFIWTAIFPYTIIHKEHPDIVIQEIVERNLTLLAS